MSKIERLKQSARQSAQFRGHEMSRFMTTYRASGKTMAMATCERCHCMAYVNTRPLPNEIEIAGNAVAVGCGRQSCRG